MFYLGFWIVSGGIAQLVERLVRNEKARGSNPLTSSSETLSGYRANVKIGPPNPYSQLTSMRVNSAAVGLNRYVLSRARALISRSFKTMSHSYQASNRQYVRPALPSRIPPRNRYI
jgi:hypothetical protein